MYQRFKLNSLCTSGGNCCERLLRGRRGTRGRMRHRSSPDYIQHGGGGILSWYSPQTTYCRIILRRSPENALISSRTRSFMHQSCRVVWRHSEPRLKNATWRERAQLRARPFVRSTSIGWRFYLKIRLNSLDFHPVCVLPTTPTNASVAVISRR